MLKRTHNCNDLRKDHVGPGSDPDRLGAETS